MSNKEPMMKEGIDHYESATRIEYTIYEGIKELCLHLYSGFLPSAKMWQNLEVALIENGDNPDWCFFLYSLSKKEGWSTRKNAWKCLRDNFAPHYKQWLKMYNKTNNGQQMSLFDENIMFKP